MMVKNIFTINYYLCFNLDFQNDIWIICSEKYFGDGGCKLFFSHCGFNKAKRYQYSDELCVIKLIANCFSFLLFIELSNMYTVLVYLYNTKPWHGPIVANGANRTMLTAVDAERCTRLWPNQWSTE